MQKLIEAEKPQQQNQENKENNIPQIVSFFHGLEGGKGGSKHRYLTANYNVCILKSMEMSKFKLSQKNSFLRTLISNWFRPSKAAEASLIGCLNIQIEEVSKNRPDIIVGSSWGGGIGLLLLSEGHWDGPIVLIAPALKHILDKVGQTQNLKWNEIIDKINSKNLGQNILFIHGTKDNVIPYETSVDAQSKIIGSRLITIEKGNHPLTKQLIHEDTLKYYINDHYKTYKQRIQNEQNQLLQQKI